jgi:predicted nucleic acid-binding protein
LVVSNSSPLIALEQIGQLDLLQALFVTLLVPPAVVRETAPTVSLPDWVTERPLSQQIGPQILSSSLGPGESEAISLALEIGAQWLILDDRPARRLARSLGLPVIGTLGVLLAAKRRGLVDALRPQLDGLTKSGFFIAPDLYEQILADGGEAG